ncbi:MAG TPA: ATP-binding protein, partial [Candidatus Krumholzibacterium sp.]|nr:ATP-binding protein [Candidatus Krumholzibacterium sp.]
EREEENVAIEGTLALDGGRSIPVRLSTTRITGDDYQGSTLIAVFEDLTVQKSMEEELRRADRLRSLGELSAGVAHEIRNPLTGIATTAQVLKEQLQGESEKVKYLTVILDEIRRLDDIIRNLLSFARPALPRPEEIEITALVRDTVELVSDKAAERKVAVEVVSELEDGDCFLDRDQIRQVVLNLSRNGIEACEPGGELVIGIRSSDDPVFFRIEFRDTGCGVPAEVADKLYNPFFTTRAEGTGLGLSISRKIVESHGGRIYHEDGEVKGTRFVVEIPRRIAATPDGVVTEKVH